MKSNFNPLSSVLTLRDSSGIVCQRDTVFISWKSFLSDVSNLYLKLISEKVSGKFLLYCKSSYQFTVALFSVWQTGSVCVLPSNNSREVLKKFENYVDAFISDQPDCDTGLRRISPLQSCSEICLEFNQLPDNKVLLEMFTSGTTGERKCVRKTITNLNSELLVHYNRFGSILEDARTFSTVSHQHIYGLLHKILLPVCTNRMFIDETYFYPEKLIADMNNGLNSNILISGPAHLKVFPELVNVNGMDKYCKAIFSSGSLLDAETARKFSLQSGIHPIEVLGSTETGGVAWRTQTLISESKKWTPFRSVQIKRAEDGFLQVNSPFIFQEDLQNEWFTMGDIVDICEDNKFYLLGRGDRIVKIGEKRISLEEMEMILKSFRNVNSCAVFPISRNYGGFNRTVLACVVETSIPVHRDARKKEIDNFKFQLLQYYTQTLIPKYWRFTKKIPIDTQGKITVEELEKLFKMRSGNA